MHRGDVARRPCGPKPWTDVPSRGPPRTHDSHVQKGGGGGCCQAARPHLWPPFRPTHPPKQQRTTATVLHACDRRGLLSLPPPPPPRAGMPRVAWPGSACVGDACAASCVYPSGLSPPAHLSRQSEPAPLPACLECRLKQPKQPKQPLTHLITYPNTLPALPGVQACLPAAKALLDTCRSAGMAVVYVLEVGGRVAAGWLARGGAGG